MIKMNRFWVVFLAIALPGAASPGAAQESVASASSSLDEGGAAITAPSTYLGYPVGSDFQLAGWDSITGYFNLLAEASPALRLDTLGSTTLGRPLVMATISTPGNLSRLDEIRAVQARLADPRRLEDGELDRLLETQPAVILVAHNIHSSEIASSQGAMELAFELATDPWLQERLRDVVVLLIPSVNPDGQAMIVDWYSRIRGTPYEGSGMPWLYHHYVGHDNNRDWFMLTQVETRLVTEVLYHHWFPEIVYDVHQMGNDGARFFIPPFDDPVNPNLDPMLVRMISFFGLRVATDLEAAGKAGVVTGETYDLWWHGGNRTVPSRHNMVGILSETASARLASPIFQEADDLDDVPPRGVAHPNPWPGGWWRMADIIDYQMISTRSMIDLAARQRRWLIRSFVELGRRAIAAGRAGAPYAYVIPEEQRDPGSAARMLEILRLGGVEIHRAEAPFVADGRQYGAGSRVVLMAQPYRAHAKDLLEPQDYPDLRLYPGGPPDRPYDVTGWTLPLQMGVRAIEITGPFEAELSREAGPIRPPPGSVNGSGPAYILDNTTNAANLAIHRALAAGAEVAIVPEAEPADASRPVGSVLLRGAGVREMLEALASEEGLVAESFSGATRARRLSPPRLALYQPWTASMDEGWTRWVFERWELPYETVHNADLRADDLTSRFDVIVLPDVPADRIVTGRAPGTVPAEYAGGIGLEGVHTLRRFVDGGGTLVCLDTSCNLAIEHLGLPVRNVRPPDAEQREGRAFYAPGSILNARLDPMHPLAYGMPDETAVYYANSAIFEPEDGVPDVTVVGRYPSGNPLLSGYALHPDFVGGRAALVEVNQGKGRVVLFGFRPQHRGQPHETFKILFNAVYRGSLGEPERLEF